MSRDWIWGTAETKDATVLPSVRAIAVYTNPAGDIVIRQEGSGYGDEPEDDVVVVPRASVPKLLKAVKAEAAKEFEPEPD